MVYALYTIYIKLVNLFNRHFKNPFRLKRIFVFAYGTNAYRHIAQATLAYLGALFVDAVHTC